MSSFHLPRHGDDAALEPAEVVLRFLESVGRRGDAEFYLSLFRAAKQRFACISVDAPVLRAALDAVVLDLRFLSTLGLTPVVVVGLLEGDGAQQQASQLAAALGRVQVRARIVRPDYFARPADLADAVTAATAAATVPLVPLSRSASGTLGQRFATMHRLVLELKTRKLIYLQRRGSLLHGGKPVALVNLHRDYEPLMQSSELSQKQRILLREARNLVLEQAAHPCTVAIASPLDLLRELFTVKGAGTLLRPGAVIHSASRWEALTGDRLRDLLQSAFGRRLRPRFFSRPLWRIYYEAGYRGAAILADTPLGAYLSKFAVEREAQGEGIGGDIWQHLLQAHPVLFWRSRRDNPIDAWYVRQCDGFLRGGQWNIFWKGIAPTDVAAVVQLVEAQPADFD